MGCWNVVWKVAGDEAGTGWCRDGKENCVASGSQSTKLVEEIKAG